MKMFNSQIDIKSFFQKGVKRNKEEFFVGLITGYQGTGKTYLGLYLLDHLPNDRIIYTNIQSYKNPKRKSSILQK